MILKIRQIQIDGTNVNPLNTRLKYGRDVVKTMYDDVFKLVVNGDEEEHVYISTLQLNVTGSYYPYIMVSEKYGYTYIPINKSTKITNNCAKKANNES